MIKKINSGGQTGADQAALDTAIKWDIPHGGWIPKGGRTEAGPLPDRYQLKEMPTGNYPARTEQNVIDSDGTLIITHGELTGGFEYTWKMTKKHSRPYFHADLSITSYSDSAQAIYSWIKEHSIEILNVAGSRASKDPDIYRAVMKILEIVFHLDPIESTMPDTSSVAILNPRTIDEAVDALIAELPLRNKTTIANMKDEELIYLHPTIGRYIGDKFGLWRKNSELLRSCCSFMEVNSLNADDASAIVITRLWRKLKETHTLRAVK
ncbi:MAG: putative molybdenum carrier protein [Desulfobacteraceae bacterium]|nr:putative molybdenum carrier protein [Desulfobacteraceae bacterium]